MQNYSGVDDMTSRAELEEIAKAAAKETVNELFGQLGIETDAAGLRTYYANMAFLYKMRKFSESLGSKIVMTCVLGILSLIGMMAWAGVKKSGG